MRIALITAIAFLLALIGGTAPAATRDPAVEAPITTFIASFNKGDNATAKAQMAAGGVVILDEVPPYRWAGPRGFDQWVADYGRDAALNGITDPAVEIAAPSRMLVNGAHAYVIVPATYRFKAKGVAMREEAQMTFVLDRGASGWKIVAWTWTGPDASPVR